MMVQMMREKKRQQEVEKLLFLKLACYTECVSEASDRSGRGWEEQSIFPFIECSVRWANHNPIQTAPQSRASTLIPIIVNTT